MPLMPYVLTTAGLVSTIALFLTLKREVRRQAARHKARIEEMLTRLNEADLREPAPQVISTDYIPAPARAGLNLNKRVHAMRMLRRGEDIGHISAALGVPRREVELLIRVQSIGKTRAAKAGEN